MEDSAVKDQSSASCILPRRSTSGLLRYPLRSATRPKEEKPPLADSTNSNSAAKKGRGRGTSSVIKSVSVLDASSKDKPSKPPRRLSVPLKSKASPAPKSVGNITPISETRAMRSSANKGKSDSPLSDILKSAHRKKFSVISSASYWLSQIRLSESSAKHSVSLGFFKLALEARCEPMQRMSDELKSYVHRHCLTELGEPVKELFERYNITKNFEQLQVSETSSQVGHQLSDNDDVNSSSSITDAEKLKPIALGKSVAGNDRAVKATDEVRMENDSVKKTRRSVPGNVANQKPSSETTRGCSMQRKSRKPIKQESAQDSKVKQGKKYASDEGPLNSPPNEENKENMEAAIQMQEDSAAVEV